ncbi:MAG: ATP-binding cassette domain-containing protein [Candidatus Omnitrophica bacterium]|nr:ATP-binding cassette domain-containing protein [Candidatus Omnitrophota bacterium]
MISARSISLQFGQRTLFEKVDIDFSAGRCYGLIGANGSGKSTFLKILAGQLEPTRGHIMVPPNERISLLKQDHFAYDEFSVLTVVIMGHQRLYEIMQEKDAIYAKSEHSNEDGMRIADLETEFADLDGWNAEPEAAKLLADLGVDQNLHQLQMKQLEGGQKVRVMLAQALFGNPDILLLDEPTNQLDMETALTLEEFLLEFKNTAIVVSHDRHFLNRVCTHIADIDFGKIQLFTGNYDFWRESSELALKQKRDANKKDAAKRKELQEFIARFSANASKSKQATSRKKLLDSLTLEDIKPSSRKYPWIDFTQDREAGNHLLTVEGLSYEAEGQTMFADFNLMLNRGDKIALLGANDLLKTSLLRILMGELEPTAGEYRWGISTTQAYYPKDNTTYFNSDQNLVEWLRQYSKDPHETYIRGFLGRVLFSGEESQKSVNVLSGGEKVRCMLAKMMLSGANVLLLDEPTNHLDLESITALNQGLIKYKGSLIFASHDHEFVQTVANRIIEFLPNGTYIDQPDLTLDEYLADPKLKALRHQGSTR